MTEFPKTKGAPDGYRETIADLLRIERSDDPVATMRVKQMANLLRVTLRGYEGWRQRAMRAGLDDFDCAELAKDVGAFMLLIGHAALLDDDAAIAHFIEAGRADLNDRLTRMSSWFQAEPNA